MRPAEETPQLTFGIVSRTGALFGIHPAFGALATDAAVSEANRGGPLVDVDGRLLGILVDVDDTNPQGYLTRARGAYAGNAGLGFAVPWHVIASVLPRIREGGVLKPAFLGVATMDTRDGLEVVDVTEKNAEGQPTAARQAGIAKGDVILSIGGREVRTTREMRMAIAGFTAGDKTTVRVRRAGAESALDVSFTGP
jgi:S1-C subfamily serine protease